MPQDRQRECSASRRRRILVAAAGGVVLLTSSVGVASAGAVSPPPAPPGQMSSGGSVPVPTAPLVRHQELSGGRTIDTFADGSSLGTAPMLYVSPADVKAGAVGRLQAGQTPQQVLGAEAVNTPSPDGSVSGNCGTSYVYLYNGNLPSGLGYHYDTGFKDTCISMSSPSIDYTWHVTITHPGYVRPDYDNGHPIYTYNLGLNNHWSTVGFSTGTYVACVVQPSGAYLQNGGYASSGGPCGAASIY